MEKKKLIPYPKKGTKRMARGLILDYRARVVTLANTIGRSIIVKSRSHDNSLACPEELNYTKWMANQDVQLDDLEYTKTLEHHYENNDHHLEHFKKIDEMDLQQLSLYLCDVMAQISYEDCENDDTFIEKVEAKLEETGMADPTIRMILKNTVSSMITYSPASVRGVYKLNEQKKETE